MVKTLVFGATGTQGGATARALLQSGHEVHALVRNPDADAAQVLQAQGAVLFKGHTDDVASLDAAVAGGVSAVFWVSMISFADLDEEVRGTRNIIAAARRAGTVRTLVYSTAMMADEVRRRELPLWDHNPFMKTYWDNKIAGEAAVRDAGGEGFLSALPGKHYTILRPVDFMTSFVNPAAAFQYPDIIAEGVWHTAVPPDFPLTYIDPEDVGRLAAAAIADPERFGGRELDVAADRVPARDAIALLGAAAGKNMRLETYGREEALRRSAENPVLLGQLLRVQKAEVDPESNTRPLDDYGLGFRGLKEFLERNKARIIETFKSAP
ncbi:hypothetical protein SLS62_000487 [Diatrype stigma]|uniref:NmrA-like domain-containing protein n=1 Tax=Diatrype stigma TaxID=117547 RepID=A0AAN9YWR6_9PEZI